MTRSSLARRAVPLALIALAPALVATWSVAATPDKAPAASNAQVQAALVALAPAFLPTRALRGGAEGTIEFVIGRYSPLRFHPVLEGSLLPARAAVACPDGMAPIASRFCIDRFEASLVEQQPDGTKTPHSPYLSPVPGRVYLARSARGEVPQAYLSGAQAEAACNAAGKRLCQPVEWRAACGGTIGYAYPYGPTRIKEKCHDGGASPMISLYGAPGSPGAKASWSYADFNDPRLNQMPNTVAKSGASPDCVSDQGVYDMVGNLHEWTADPNGTFQGGYWLDTAEHGDGCAYRTIAHGFTYHDYSTGFRCCADPNGP